VVEPPFSTGWCRHVSYCTRPFSIFALRLAVLLHFRRWVVSVLFWDDSFVSFASASTPCDTSSLTSSPLLMFFFWETVLSPAFFCQTFFAPVALPFNSGVPCPAAHSLRASCIFFFSYPLWWWGEIPFCKLFEVCVWETSLLCVCG